MVQLPATAVPERAVLEGVAHHQVVVASLDTFQPSPVNSNKAEQLRCERTRWVLSLGFRGETNTGNIERPDALGDMMGKLARQPDEA